MADKVAVITGGASGIGRATAKQLAADGFAIAVLDMNQPAGEEVAAELTQEGTFAKFYPCDVTSASLLEELADRIETEMGPVEVLVTAAGLIPNAESVLDMDMEAHTRMWKVNYDGTLFACQSFARRMSSRMRGAIVTIGSINSHGPLPLPAYNVGKLAVERISQLLACELGRFNIRVNSVGPTYVMTPPLREKVADGTRDLNKIMAVHALKYLPDPEDVANAISFLASSKARAITGILLPVDSGWISAVSYNTYAGGVPWQD